MNKSCTKYSIKTVNTHTTINYNLTTYICRRLIINFNANTFSMKHTSCFHLSNQKRLLQINQYTAIFCNYSRNCIPKGIYTHSERRVGRKLIVYISLGRRVAH